MKYMTAALAILGLLLIASGLALKHQVGVIATQKRDLEIQAQTIRAAEENRQKAETAVALRDATIQAMNGQLTNYRSRLRAMEVKYAEVADWSRQRVPEPVHKLLCELTHSTAPACQSAPDADPGPPRPPVDGDDKR